MTGVLIAGLLLLAQSPAAGGAPTPESIQKRVQSVLDQGIPGVDPAVRSSYADRLSAPFLKAPTSEQIPQLLSDLPRALEFHTLQVQMYEIKSDIPGLPKVTLPSSMLEEGYQIQVDYLAARVDRAVQLGWSPQTKSEIARQIQSLTDTAREILASKVLGDVGTRFAENEATMARSTWIRSLDLPYNRFIDTPLPPEELRRILDAMHEAAASTAPLALTEEQLNNPESRRILGIQSLVDKVLTAASGSMTYCYRQFNERDRRIEEWNVRANACRDQEIEKAFRTYVPVPPRDPKDARAGTLPASSSRMAPVLPDASTESVRILDSGVSSAPSTRRVGVVLVLALLILVAVSVIARRSR